MMGIRLGLIDTLTSSYHVREDMDLLLGAFRTASYSPTLQLAGTWDNFSRPEI